MVQPRLWRSELLQSIIDYSKVLKYRNTRLSGVDAGCGVQCSHQLAPKLLHILKGSPVSQTHVGGNDRFNGRWQWVAPNALFYNRL